MSSGPSKTNIEKKLKKNKEENAMKMNSNLGFCQQMLSAGKYLVIIMLLPPFLNYTAMQQEQNYLKPEGELYDIGYGQKLYLGCKGSGFPTVILDAPTGMSSDVWVTVQDEISKVTKVCVYDRAGLGFSDRPPFKNASEESEIDKNNPQRWKEFTVERMADDLHRLISWSSDQKKPVVMVGSEMGALVARFYTQIYETEVSDLVLVDPLVEGVLQQDEGVWSQFWFGQLVPSLQAMQLSAALGWSRIALLLGVMSSPISAQYVDENVIKRQKYLLCNPRHLSSSVDEHFFINDTLSQMETVYRIKPFPAGVKVTVITGNYYDEQLPSALNKAWAKSQQHLISTLHPTSHHIVVNSADHHMLYKKSEAVVEPLIRIVKKRRAEQKATSS